MTKQLATIVTVREGSHAGMIVARFVFSDDARAFAAAATEREPGRTLVVEDRRGEVNEVYVSGIRTWN